MLSKVPRSMVVLITVPDTEQLQTSVCGEHSLLRCARRSAHLVPGCRLQPPLPACAASNYSCIVRPLSLQKRATQAVTSGTKQHLKPPRWLEAGSAFQSALDCVPSQRKSARDSPRHREVFKHRTVQRRTKKCNQRLLAAVSLFESLCCSASRGWAGPESRCIQRHSKLRRAPYAAAEEQCRLWRSLHVSC